jgi:hypothetical protein
MTAAAEATTIVTVTGRGIEDIGLDQDLERGLESEIEIGIGMSVVVGGTTYETKNETETGPDMARVPEALGETS